MAEKYKPRHEDDLGQFLDEWCCNCARDKAMSEGLPVEECDDNERCNIIADTFAYAIDDPKYPKEWIYDEGKPCCTAFIEAGQLSQRRETN